MKCPDEGLLLAYLERQLSNTEMSGVDHHLASCRICKRRLQVLQEDLSFCHLEMKSLLQKGAEAPVNGQYRVWDAIDKASDRNKGVEVIMKLRKIAVAAVVVLTMVGLLSIPSVKAVADNLLQVFRVNQVSTVTLTPEDINHLRSALTMGDAEINVEQFGQIKTLGEPGVKKQVALNQLPLGVKLLSGQSPLALYVEDMPDVELKLNVGNVNKLLQQLGSSDKLPETLEGQTFRLVLPEMVTANYGDFRLLQGASPEMHAPAGIDI
ncbi:MAG: anti-sigma factor family protein, partial [Methylocystaceae bacterium]